jgi:hypothetical protein
VHDIHGDAVVSLEFRGTSASEAVEREAPIRTGAGQGVLTGEAAILLHLLAIDCKVSLIFNRSAVVIVRSAGAIPARHPAGPSPPFAARPANRYISPEPKHDAGNISA